MNYILTEKQESIVDSINALLQEAKECNLSIVLNDNDQLAAYNTEKRPIPAECSSLRPLGKNSIYKGMLCYLKD